MKTKKYLICGILLSLIFILSIFAIAADSISIVKSCCEKTTYGAWCQNAPQADCNAGFRSTPTSCEATSFCKLGCCYDSSEGICMENTPQRVCADKNGTWAESKDCEIPQCKPGCCVIGTQAAFTTLTRCKKISSFYGLQIDFRQQISSELECISLASLSDQGACVYSLDYTKTCKFTSRQECNTMKEGMKVGNATIGGVVTGNVTFYKDLLCSAEELGTNCGLTKETTCIEGKDEVYFKDSCGNPSNIYDSSKINDKNYWRTRVNKAESCNSNSANTNNPACGNCDYFSGSICKKSGITNKPTYGSNICVDLNCKTTTLGTPMKHGESWCSTDKYPDSVGSRYFRHICMNGEEILEPCADFRQEECIQDKIVSKGIEFSQAGCRVNRWQDCTAQKEKIDCENIDKRDCAWKYETDEVKTKNNQTEIACFPLHPPGLKFWETGEAQTICAQANKQCTVTYESTGFFMSSEPKAVDGEECLTDAWKVQQLTKCEALGDCGGKVNFVGVQGFKEGYKISTEKVKSTDSGSGGLLG